MVLIQVHVPLMHFKVHTSILFFLTSPSTLNTQVAAAHRVHSPWLPVFLIHDFFMPISLALTMAVWFFFSLFLTIQMLLAVFSLLFIIKNLLAIHKVAISVISLLCPLLHLVLRPGGLSKDREAEKTDRFVGGRKVFTIHIRYRIVRGLWEISKQPQQCLWDREERGRLSNVRATSLWSGSRKNLMGHTEKQ